MRVLFLVLLGACGLSTGCLSEESTGADAGVSDAADHDAGVGDAGGLDAGPTDAGLLDGGVGDGGDPLPNDPGRVGTFSFNNVSDSVVRGSRTTPVTACVPDRRSPAHLIVFFPGFQLESARYATYCERLATHGFLVVRADPPAALFAVSHTEMAADGAAVIDWAQATFGASLTGAIGLTGHSLGGKVATMIAAADPRVDALLPIDPVNGGDPFAGFTAELPDIVPEQTAVLTIPVGYLGETTNGTGGSLSPACAPLDQNYQTFFEGSTQAPWAAEWTFAGADHMDFVPDVSGCGFVCTACPDGPASAAEVQASALLLSVAFFRRHLGAEAAMELYLDGGLLPAGITVRR